MVRGGDSQQARDDSDTIASTLARSHDRTIAFDRIQSALVRFGSDEELLPQAEYTHIEKGFVTVITATVAAVAVRGIGTTHA